MSGFAIEDVRVRLCRVPVDPPRGDAIQQFDALELPMVDIVDGAGRHGIGFGYTIGTGGTAIVALFQGATDDEAEKIKGLAGFAGHCACETAFKTP